MAAALTGCVVVGVDKMGVRYKEKCEFCGWVGNAARVYKPAMPGNKYTNAFSCPKCKKRNKLIVQG